MQTRIGSLLITSSSTCTPQRCLDGIAWSLPCGGTVENTGRHTVSLAAEVVDSQGQPQGEKQQASLAPGASLALEDPGAGNEWLVVAVSREQVMLWGWGLLGGLITLGGLAGYGGYALIRDLRHRRRGRR